MTALRPTTLLLVVLVMVTVAGWRWWPSPWWLIASVSCIVAGGALRSRQQRSPLGIIALLFLAVILSPMISIPWLWPCGLDCQGLGHYARWGGMPTWLWGMLAYVTTLACALLAWRWPKGAGAWLAPAALIACAGASVYFLWLSWHLQVLCNHCLAIHTVILTALALNVWVIAWKTALAVGLITALALHAAFHPVQLGSAADSPDPDPGSLLHQTPAEDATYGILAAAMTMGDNNAPWSAQLVLDPLCPHCRQAWQEVAHTLGPLVGSGDLRLRIRLRSNPRLELSRDLASWLVASAIIDSLPQHLPHLIGHSQRVTSQQLQQRWSQEGSSVALASLQRIAQLNDHTITHYLQADRQWIQDNRLLTTATPVLLLHGPGVERKLWSDRLPLEEVRQYIAP
ncbi:MAG: hypothetical protein EA401_03665 [Planctomycetota bacterium]|nr:MAG: hypothetical protein EA401_03665 [Planctomycetota bacterium]